MLYTLLDTKLPEFEHELQACSSTPPCPLIITFKFCEASSRCSRFYFKTDKSQIESKSCKPSTSREQIKRLITTKSRPPNIKPNHTLQPPNKAPSTQQATKRGKLGQPTTSTPPPNLYNRAIKPTKGNQLMYGRENSEPRSRRGKSGILITRPESVFCPSTFRVFFVSAGLF